MNKYRVDRSDGSRIPCGMNSLIYLGNNYRDALRAFKAAATGLDYWNQPRPEYGVILSQWNDAKLDYAIIAAKGITSPS
jgi:hypothetical protein